METQEQKDERMALELFPDIPASEPISTKMTMEEADATIKSLTSMLIAARTERNRLREAISDAGFSVMQTSGRWSIHDVSELAKAEQAKTDEIIGQNIDLEIKLKKLEAMIQRIQDAHQLPTYDWDCMMRIGEILKSE